MANIKSQKKRNRQNEKRRLRNKAVRSELKTRVKNADAAIAAGADDASDKIARRAEAPRQSRRQGRDPQEPGGPTPVPLDEARHDKS